MKKEEAWGGGKPDPPGTVLAGNTYFLSRQKHEVSSEGPHPRSREWSELEISVCESLVQGRWRTVCREEITGRQTEERSVSGQSPGMCPHLVLLQKGLEEGDEGGGRTNRPGGQAQRMDMTQGQSDPLGQR